MRTGHHRERDSLVSAVTGVFRPLARALMDHGVSVPEAESLLRAVSVHEVANVQTARGKRPNASRIALLTGLDRKEITRILRQAPRIDPALEARCHRANKVLSGWYGDRTFVHNDKPLVLPIKTEKRKRPSFWMLASRYAPGVYPGLILNELSRVGALEKLRDGRVRVRMRWYRSTRDLRIPGSRKGPVTSRT
jgi:hypothetical protein